MCNVCTYVQLAYVVYIILATIAQQNIITQHSKIVFVRDIFENSYGKPDATDN